MGDVVEFPTQDKRLANLTDEINKGVTELETLYTELDELHAKINELESSAFSKEKEYDVFIKEYVDEVGIEDTPALWLTYSRSCVVKATGEGEYKMVWLGSDWESDDG